MGLPLLIGLWLGLLSAGAGAASCDNPKNLFDTWVSPVEPALVFVSGANPYPGELPTLRKKAESHYWNMAVIAPAKLELAEAGDLVDKRLLALEPCFMGPVTVMCHSKGCDAVAESLRRGEAAEAESRRRLNDSDRLWAHEAPRPFWKGYDVVLVNPLIPGGAGIPPFMGGWAGEIHPKHENRARLFGRTAGHWSKPRTLVVMDAEKDKIVASRAEYEGDWLPADFTLSLKGGARYQREHTPVDRENLALQWDTDVSQLKDDTIYGGDSDHAILLFTNDLFERIAVLRKAKADASRLGTPIPAGK